MKACQQFIWSPGGTQPLTYWMGFHEGVSAIQIEPRRYIATHILDGIHEGVSAIQIEPRRCTGTHLLDGIS